MDTVHECDRQTDRRTDIITITKTVQSIASHGNNGAHPRYTGDISVIGLFTGVPQTGSVKPVNCIHTHSFHTSVH